MMTADQLRAFLTKINVGFLQKMIKAQILIGNLLSKKSSAISTNHNLSFNGGGEHTTL